jgi:hypothetical protein
MMFETVYASFDPADKKEVAKSILDFFIFQYQRALERYINCKGVAEGNIFANKMAQDAYHQSDDIGWGPKLPYSERDIELNKKEEEKAKKDLDETKALLNFIKTRFVEKFVE